MFVFFIRSLALEYEKSGIIIQSLCPYFVSTKISHLRSNLLVPKPGVFVNDSLKTIKLQKITNGTFLHNLQVKLIKLFAELKQSFRYFFYRDGFMNLLFPPVYFTIS